VNHLRVYRAAVRLLPRSHRDRFAEEQMQLYADLTAHGMTPWRLWLGLPRDLAAVHARTRAGRSALQVTGGPQVAGGPQVTPWAPHRLARTGLSWFAAALHTGWLTAHVAAGLYWQEIKARAATELGDQWTTSGWSTYLDETSGPHPQLDRMLTTLATADLWLLALFVVAVTTVGRLPARRWFMLAWVVLWPIGMLLRIGYGAVTS
jgi:hypothetical protein